MNLHGGDTLTYGGSGTQFYVSNTSNLPQSVSASAASLMNA